MSDMTYRNLGDSGLRVSTVGLGCNNFGMRIDEDASRLVIDAALDAGITLFDTSDSYGESESIIGRALGARRDDVILASKFGSDLRGANGADWGSRGARRYIRRSIERSLSRLQTDHLDLYQIHMPDPTTPITETLAALSELVHEGLVR
ncbi:MAG: aldo/keto reductase, partial [Actinomycetales bacterium]